MASINKVQLLGRLGKDPEVRVMSNGNKVVSFSLATEETWRDKATGERKSRTEWHNIVIFNEHLGKVAEAYLLKGMRCLVEGKIQTRKWQDSQGIDRYSTEIVLQQYAGELCLLDGLKEAESKQKEEKHESNGNGSFGGSNARSYDDLDDEIPF